MKRRLLLGLLLAAALLSLRSVVFACGIEETWIPGIYDGGDTDDALALAGSKALESAASPVLPAPDVVFSRAVVPLAADPSSFSVVALPSRSPPLL
jgi:hypothetical protein